MRVYLRPRNRSPLSLATAGAFVTLLPLLALAQSRVDSGTLLRSVPELPIAPARRDSVQVQPVEPPAPASKADTGTRVNVSAFRFTGNRRFPEQELAGLLSAYVGTQVSFAGQIGRAHV